MPGILDYLSTLAQAVAGQMPQQQPQVPPQAQVAQGGPTFAPDASGNLQAMQTPPPQTAQPPQQGGLTGFLSSPLTQGALGAYFGAIGAPRRSGLGGMLSQGGLTGLSEFGQAQQRQLQQQLMQRQTALLPYQIQALQARAGQSQAAGGLARARTEQIGGIGDANAALAAQIHASEQFMTPEQAQRAHILETAIANDTSKVYDPKEVFAQIYEQPLKEKEISEQIALAKAREGEIPGEEAMHTAEAARANAEAAKAKGGGDKPDWYDPVAKRYYGGPKQNPNDVPASKGPSLTPKGGSLKTITKVAFDSKGVPYNVTYSLDPKTNKGVPMSVNLAPSSYYASGPLERLEKYATPTTMPSSKEFKSIGPEEFGTEASAGESGSGLPPLPSGATEYAVGPDGVTVGYHDTAGTFHPFVE